MTAQQLKERAKENGISLNMTKQETIELLDKLEPGVDHSGLMGKELAAAKQKHGIGILKNKQQLVDALQKKAGADMAESVKAKDGFESGVRSSNLASCQKRREPRRIGVPIFVNMAIQE